MAALWLHYGYSEASVWYRQNKTYPPRFFYVKICEKWGCFALVFSLFLHAFIENRNEIVKCLCFNDLCDSVLL